MFTIKIGDIVAHNPASNTAGHQLSNPVLTTGASQAGSISFEIARNNAAYEILDDEGIAPVAVYFGNDLVWKGRILDFGRNFNNVKAITAEGSGSLLNDVQISAEFWENLEEYDLTQNGISLNTILTRLRTTHNLYCNPSQMLYYGTIPSSSEKMLTEEAFYKLKKTDYASTKEIIEDIRNQVGGDYYFSYNTSRTYLTYTLGNYIRTNSQVINFGKSLIDINKTLKKSELCTVIIPVGANNLTIEDVPAAGGNYFIKASDAILNKYGQIWKKVTFDTDDDMELYTLAVAYLRESVKPQVSIQATAIDLSILDDTLPYFRPGDLVRVYSQPHDIDMQLPIQSIRLDIANPGNSEFTLGTPESKLV